MRKDLGARLACDPGRAAEVIRMGVGHDDRVHVAQRQVGLAQPVLERLPGSRARETRVDQGGALAVDERVAVDVAEPRHVHGKLQPEHPGSELDDLRVRGLLLLSLGHRPSGASGRLRRGNLTQKYTQVYY